MTPLPPSGNSETETADKVPKSWQYDASNPGRYSGIILKQETTLDLSLVELFGWEKYLYREKIDRFVSEISQGDSFPPVPVVDFEDHYSLAYWALRSDYSDGSLPDGEHHRSRAH